MKFIKTIEHDNYKISTYTGSDKKDMFIITTSCIDTLRVLKVRGWSGGYRVSKVWIYGDYKSFRMVVRRGNIYKDGRTVYYKGGKRIPYYLTII